MMNIWISGCCAGMALISLFVEHYLVCVVNIICSVMNIVVYIYTAKSSQK